jgi:hypothetical protein
MPTAGFGVGEQDEVTAHLPLHHIPQLTAVSSTQLRTTDDIAVLQNPANLHPALLRYIEQHNLYMFGRRKALQRRLAVVAVAAAVWAAAAALTLRAGKQR